MDQNIFIKTIHSVADEYLSGRIVGKEFVRRFDDLMADELPDDIPEMLLEILNQYHVEFALYVEDENQRNEHPAYYGPEVLFQTVKVFKDKLSIVST